MSKFLIVLGGMLTNETIIPNTKVQTKWMYAILGHCSAFNNGKYPHCTVGNKKKTTLKDMKQFNWEH